MATEFFTRRSMLPILLLAVVGIGLALGISDSSSDDETVIAGDEFSGTFDLFDLVAPAVLTAEGTDNVITTGDGDACIYAGDVNPGQGITLTCGEYLRLTLIGVEFDRLTGENLFITG